MSHLGGAASGTPLEQRQRLGGEARAATPLGGSSGKFLLEERPQYSYMVFLCGPDVATVHV